MFRKLAFFSPASICTYLHKPLQTAQIPGLHQQRSGRLSQCPIEEHSILGQMQLKLVGSCKNEAENTPRSPVFDC